MHTHVESTAVLCKGEFFLENEIIALSAGGERAWLVPAPWEAEAKELKTNKTNKQTKTKSRSPWAVQ